MVVIRRTLKPLLGSILLFSLLFAASANTTLTFWTFLDPASDAPRSVVQTQLVEEFEAMNPGVTVDVQVVHWADIAPMLIQAVAAGRGPDVTRIASDSLEQQYAARTLHPLTEYVDALPAADVEDWILPFDMGTDDGVKRAMWIEHRAVMLWYYEDLLADLGVGPPRTWTEVGEIGAQLTGGGQSGFAFGLGHGGAGNGFLELFKPLLWSYGGDLVDEDGRAAFHQQPGIDAMQMLYDLVHEYRAVDQAALSWDVDGLHAGFEARRAAMISFATHRVVGTRAAVGDDLQVAPMPSATGEAPAPAHVTGWMLAVPRTSENKDLAWSLIQHMTSPEAQLLNARIAGELPARLSSFDDAWFEEDPQGQEMLLWKDYVLDYGRVPQFPPDYLFLHRLLVDAGQRIILRNEPIESVLEDIALRYDHKIGL